MKSLTILSAKLSAAYQSVKGLMIKLNHLESDMQTPVIEKLSQIKKIREELGKIGEEIDILKGNIKLLKNYQVN